MLRSPNPRPTHPSLAPDPERVTGKVALVHDYLNQRGGAERVALELATMHPEATLATSLYRPNSTFPEFARCTIATSYLDRLPVDRGFRALLPLFPSAMRDLGVLDADVVIASSSAWAHGVRTTDRAFSVVYCHNPARWLYGAEYLDVTSFEQRLARPLFSTLRRWDQRAAQRADLYIANSENTRRRIAEVYGRDAAVVPPPVDTDRVSALPRGERLLVASRLLAYKRIDLVVEAATRAGLPLDVVGKGPELAVLRALAGPTVTFHGTVTDTEMTRLMEQCRAFCLPGEEDFGMTCVEAQAAGKPVVAFAGGGALETVVEGRTGAFFTEQTPDVFLEALRRCDAMDADHHHIAAHAEQFSRGAFRQRIAAVIATAREAAAAR